MEVDDLFNEDWELDSFSDDHFDLTSIPSLIPEKRTPLDPLLSTPKRIRTTMGVTPPKKANMWIAERTRDGTNTLTEAELNSRLMHTRKLYNGKKTQMCDSICYYM